MTAETFRRVTTILRETHPTMRHIFTSGGCFELYRMLHTINPAADCYYDGPKAHVMTRLGNTYFDIDGPCITPPGSLQPLNNEPRIYCQAYDWKDDFWKKP